MLKYVCSRPSDDNICAKNILGKIPNNPSFNKSDTATRSTQKLILPMHIDSIVNEIRLIIWQVKAQTNRW
jgi:hypothetical protein